jgi:hypothetical protein
MLNKTTGFGLALFIALASPGRADTLTFTTTMENTLIETAGTASQLSNALGDIYAGRTNQDGSGTATMASIRRGLIEFNVAGSSISGGTIPPGATITGGTLTMYDLMGNGSQTISLYDVSDPWGQGTSSGSNGAMGVAATNGDATWYYSFFNSANPAQSTPWTTPGGDFNSLMLTASATDPGTGAGEAVIWSSANNPPQMITDIQNWLDDPGANFGWLLQGNESKAKTAAELAAGMGIWGTSQEPTLTVSYTVPEPSTLALLAVGTVGLAGYRLRRTPRLTVRTGRMDSD